MKVKLPLLVTGLCLLSIITFNCFADVPENKPDANTPVRLDDYLRCAAMNNAGLKAAFEQWRAAVEQVPQAKALPEPQLSYGYATESTPQRKMFEAMQMFPWFGTIEARGEVASIEAKAAYKQFEAKKLELFYEVKQAFYEHSYLAKATDITKESLALMRHFEEVARTRYATSATAHPDIIRAQIELAMVDNRLKGLEELKPAIVARLNSILNRPTASDLSWPEAPEYKEITIDSQKLLADAAKNNPQLQSLRYDIEAARGGEKLAGKRFYPDIGIGVGVDSGMGDNMSDRVMAKVALTIPIWRDNYKAMQRQARAQINKATQEKIQLENTISARVRQALYEHQNSNREIRLYRDIVIPKAKEMLAASEMAYRGGTVDFLSLLDAQRSLLQYQLEYEKAIAENAQRLAEIEMLAGVEPAKVKERQEQQ
jgi:outer membrane protein TolC